MNNTIKKIILRIIDISYKNQLSHIGSSITCAEIIYDIYNNKKKDDLFILSCGHSYLAQLVVLEYFRLIDSAEDISRSVGTHPKRDLENHTTISTGSLGMGLPISVGFAMIDSYRNVHCLISDGEIREGANWEALQFINNFSTKQNDHQLLNNLKIHVNANGYSALGSVNLEKLKQELSGFKNCNLLIHNTSFNEFNYPDFMYGLKAHYQVLNEEQYFILTKYYEQL